MPETAIIISARDLATGTMKRIGMEAQVLTQKLVSLDSMLLGVGAGLGGGMLLDKALDSFEDYETALTDMRNVTDESLTDIHKKIMDLPSNLGDPTELVQGYYQAISAGVKDPVEALDLLTNSAKASKAAHLDQSSTIKGTTKLMAGYGDEIRDAADATDLLFSIEKEGQTKFAELVPIIGDVASVAHQAGAGVEEMGAMLAAASQTAGSTSQAATQVRAVFMGLIKPQEKMRDLLKDMGYQSGAALVQELGLAGAIQAVADRAESAGIPLGRLFESSEALTVLGPMLADGFGRYNAALAEMENRAGRTEKAFAGWEQTQAASRDRFLNTLDEMATRAGQSLSPAFREMLNGLSDWMDNEGMALADGLGDIADLAGRAAGLVGTLLGNVVDGWNSLPTVIQEIGLIGALIGGAKARLALLMVTEAIGLAKDLYDAVTDYTPLAEQGVEEVQAQINAVQSDLMELHVQLHNAEEWGDIEQADKLREKIDVLAVSMANLKDQEEKAFSQRDKDLYEREYGVWTAPSPLAEGGGTTGGGGVGGGGGGGNSDEVVKALAQIADEHRKLVLGETEWEIYKANEKYDDLAVLAVGHADALVQVEEIREDAITRIREKAAADQVALAEQVRLEHVRISQGETAFDLAEANARYDKLQEMAAGNAEVLAQIAELRMNEVAEIEEEAARKRLETSGTVEAGLIRGLDEVAARSKDTSDAMKDGFVDAWESLEDTALDAMFGVETSFGDMIDSLLRDIARAQLQANVTGPIAEGLSGIFSDLFSFNAQGGVHSGPGIRSFENQVVSRPTLFAFAHGVGLMGEAGEEAILPLTQMASGNLGVEAKVSGGGSGRPIVRVHVAPGTRVVEQSQQTAGGRWELDLFIEHVEEQMARHAAAGSSPLNDSFESRYNLVPQGLFG